MQVAVSGASGFIGHHIVQQLIDRNIRTVALCRDPSKLRIRSDLLDLHIFDMDHPDEMDVDTFRQVDVLIHLAWGGLPNYKNIYHLEKELPRQFGFLSRVIRSGIKNITIAGTCFEYGMQNGPLSEDTIAKPVNCYGAAKYSLYQQLKYLQKDYNFNLTWARLFYMFGNGQAESSLYSLLLKAIENKEPVFNMSGGEQLRDFLPVSHVARSIVRLALLQQDTDLVNVCSGKPISIRKFVEDVLAEQNAKMKLNLGYYDYPDYEPMAFWGTRHKLDQLL